MTLRYVVSLILLVVSGALTSAEQRGPVQVVKIAAGPAGTEANGVFALSEERSVFSRTTDREVIVFFQWEDVPGAHALIARWSSVNGGAAASSAIDYRATDKRFGAYWRIPLTSDTPLGAWSIEATMDGRPAGRFTFEITDAKVDAAIARRPLTQAELYERLNRVFVVFRRVGADGRELIPAGGFLPEPQTGRIYTVMPAIDAAEALHAMKSDGTSQPVTRLLASHRRQQWAVVEGAAAAGDSLRIAAYGSVKVGSQCFSIEGTAAGIRVLIAGTISGQAAAAPQPLLIATFPRAVGMPGAPVVDEYGDLLGIVGAGLPPDSRPVDDVLEARGMLNGAPVIPYPLEIAAAARRADVAALRAAGEVMPPVAAGQISGGGFTRTPVKRGQAAIEFVKDFSLRDPIVGVALTWLTSERVRGKATIRVYDVDNNAVASSEPRKVDFNKGAYAQSFWQMPMLKQPGLYRVDVALDARTLWRGFLRVSP